VNTKTRIDLAKSLAPNLSLTYQESERFIVEFLSELRETLISGNKIKLKGFGTFYPVQKPERLARNPSTGEMVKSQAYTTVRFRPSSKLKKAKEEQ
jgi:nucleoid DNA-binding protein